MKPEQLRARVLSEWRGLPQPWTSPDRAVACKTAVQKVMKDLGLGERLRAGEILAAWREVVGEFIAQHSAPQQLKMGVLTVSVLQPTLHFELDRMWKRKILDALQKRFGRAAVRDIKFRIG